MVPISNAQAIDDVIALDDQRLLAMQAGDVTVLQQMLSSDLTYTHSDGRTDTRATYLAAVASGVLKYRRCERESAHASAYGEVVIVHGCLRLYALDLGQEKAIRIHYLANWVRGAGQDWQLCAWASTLIERLQ